MAKVIPIRKVKKQTTPNEYRPIALTLAMCTFFSTGNTQPHKTIMESKQSKRISNT